MNKMKATSITCVLLSLFVISCDPASKYKEEIEEIDSSLAVIDSIEQKFNGINFDSLQYMVDHVLKNEDSIKKYYQPDTLSLYIGIRMNESKGIRKTLKNLEQKESTYSTEITEIRQQLKNLKEDIKNGVLKEEKMNEYLKKEQEDLEKLNTSFEEFYTLQNIQRNYFYQSVPVIDSLLVALKNEAQ